MYSLLLKSLFCFVPKGVTSGQQVDMSNIFGDLLTNYVFELKTLNAGNIPINTITTCK